MDSNNNRVSLIGKRLLVLGCSNNANDVKSFADNEGVVIIAASLHLNKNMADIADEKYCIDILDREQVKNIIREKNIDSIFVGGSEDLISCVIDVATDLGLPFYSTRELWDTLMNKRLFKEACRKYGVPTMDDFQINEDRIELSADELPYPVVLKPVDNCGSAGVMKCEKADDFPKLYQFAKDHSRTGQVTVENFVDGFEIVVYYTFCDGKVTLSSMGDKYVRGNSHSFIPLAEIYAYPSQYLPQYIEEVDQNMREMLLGLGVKDGITSMQGFYKDGKFTFFEMGYRLGGTAQYRYTENINGINSFYMMMNLALTGSMIGPKYDQSKDNAMFKKPCCTLTLMSKGGTVAKIEGVEEARKLPEVICLENRYNVGDTIAVTRTVSQFHVRIYIVADTVKRMKEVINHLQDTIKVYDINGESMLITHFDTNKLTFPEEYFK